MNVLEIVKTVLPQANAELCDWLLWERMPYPFKKLTAKDVYKAASRENRALKNKIELCEFCSNKVDVHTLCKSCGSAMASCGKPE